MVQPLQILVDEHVHIRGMLFCFENELTVFGKGERPDYEILEGSIAYCQEFLDQWHHPREDALHGLLKNRSKVASVRCSDLGEQHRSLSHTTEDLVKIFEAVERDAEYQREYLVNKGRQLLNDYRHHIDWEEANFFPAVRQYLLPEDWQAVATRFAIAVDPLAGKPGDGRYLALFRAVERLDAF